VSIPIALSAKKTTTSSRNALTNLFGRRKTFRNLFCRNNVLDASSGLTGRMKARCCTVDVARSSASSVEKKIVIAMKKLNMTKTGCHSKTTLAMILES
jgi:hypothetical protein